MHPSGAAEVLLRMHLLGATICLQTPLRRAAPTCGRWHGLLQQQQSSTVSQGYSEPSLQGHSEVLQSQRQISQ